MPEFVPFRFEVNLYHDQKKQMLCRGYFSEVSGLELTMEPRVITEGGRNWGEHQRAGVTKFSPVILKRGVTEINDLWSWFDVTTRGANYSYRLHGEIKVLGSTLDASGQPETVLIWRLAGVLPIKFKGPDLSSTANQVAIEELHLVHESLTLERPKAGRG
jgi:phage tail-like protein